MSVSTGDDSGSVPLPGKYKQLVCRYKLRSTYTHFDRDWHRVTFEQRCVLLVQRLNPCNVACLAVFQFPAQLLLHKI